VLNDNSLVDSKTAVHKEWPAQTNNIFTISFSKKGTLLLYQNQKKLTAQQGDSNQNKNKNKNIQKKREKQKEKK
jgi:hypothetical protein